MYFTYLNQANPNLKELEDLFESAFAKTTDEDNFSHEQNQSLNEWFSLSEMPKYLPNGALIEARNETGLLLGAIFIAPQNLMNWVDGKKMEIFILGVNKDVRNQGIAKNLMAHAEKFAKERGSKKIILNAHIAAEVVHRFYQKLGYLKIGELQNYYDNGTAVFFQKVL